VAVIVCQKLILAHNSLQSLPDELSSMQKLAELNLRGNNITETPVSVLEHLTALKIIDLRNKHGVGSEEPGVFTMSSLLPILSSLLPILHPQLELLDLRQNYSRDIDFNWDQISLYHQERALAETAKMAPIPMLNF
jgi:Leucine-rich repeat (LRR) protein